MTEGKIVSPMGVNMNWQIKDVQKILESSWKKYILAGEMSRRKLPNISRTGVFFYTQVFKTGDGLKI